MIQFLNRIRRMIINYSSNGFEFNLDGEVFGVRDEEDSFRFDIGGNEVSLPAIALSEQLWIDENGKPFLHYNNEETELDIEVLEIAS